MHVCISVGLVPVSAAVLGAEEGVVSLLRWVCRWWWAARCWERNTLTVSGPYNWLLYYIISYYIISYHIIILYYCLFDAYLACNGGKKGFVSRWEERWVEIKRNNLNKINFHFSSLFMYSLYILIAVPSSSSPPSPTFTLLPPFLSPLILWKGKATLGYQPALPGTSSHSLLHWGQKRQQS